MSTQSRRWPLNTIGQLTIVVLLVVGLGALSVRRAVQRSVELPPDAEVSGEPTPLWQLPIIVAALTLFVGLLPAGGWDAGMRIGGGCVIVGLGQAVLMDRLVAREEGAAGRRYFRVQGSRILRGTKLGWAPQERPLGSKPPRRRGF